MTVTLYEKCKDGRVWFSLHDRVNDFAEITGKQNYQIPKGFEVCEDMTGEKHFYAKNAFYGKSSIAEIGTDVREDGTAFPYLYGMLGYPPDKRIYLRRPDHNNT